MTTHSNSRVVTEPARAETLSDVFVRDATRPGRYGDGRGGHGLSLLIKPTKIEGRFSKTWSQRTRVNGKEANVGLGSYPAVTLEEARRRALQNRRAVEEGRGLRSNTTPTFHQAAEETIRVRSGKWKPDGKSEQHWRASLQAHVYPWLGNSQVHTISVADVVDCLAPIWHSAPETARRVNQRIAAVMNRCVAQGHRTDNPAGDRAGDLLGFNSQPPQPVKSLHHGDVAAAVRAVEGTGAHWHTVAAFKFLTLTAAKSGQVRFAMWDEFDLTAGIWVVPAERSGTGQELAVPLSGAALTVLRTVFDLSDGKGLVFPSPTGRPLSNTTMSKLCKENNVGCVPSGMRNSFQEWCVANNVRREVADRALGRKSRGHVSGDLMERHRELLEQWSRYLDV